MTWLLLATTARAWEASGYVWLPEDMPIEIQWAGAPDGWTTDEVRDVLDSARSAWVDATCTAFDVTFVEVEATEEDSRDGIDALVFTDTDPEDGLAHTVYASTGRTTTIEDRTYRQIGEADIVVDATGPWVTDAAIEAGDCDGAYSLQGAITHQLGHLAGLGDTCAGYDVCTAEEEAAAMYGEPEPCSTAQSAPTGDDLVGLQGLYGTPISYTCDPVADDPMAARCELLSPAAADLDALSWSFDDGTTSTDAVLTHTFAEAGAHTATLCVDLPDCGAPLCIDTTVYAVAAGTVEGEAPAEDTGDDDGNGCGGSRAGVLLPLLLSAGRRRRGPPRQVYPVPFFRDR